jgi:mannan endo-1,4-beta-mannosidase
LTGPHKRPGRAGRRTRVALLAGGAFAAVLAGLTAGCGHAPASGAPAASPSASAASSRPAPAKPTASSPAAGAAAAGKQAESRPTAHATTSAPAVALGVYTPGEDGSWAAVASFGQQAGQPVKYVVDYLGPHDPFPAQFAQQAAASGAELVLQLEPTMSMASVAAGADDSYLDSLAAQVGDFGAPIILSWAAEANGNWYEYGWTQTPVADYQAAWAHVMSRFRGDHNVTWMDTLNRWYTGAGPTSQYVVPGVGLIGIDAYYDYANDTFNSVFGATLSQIRAVTDKPILVNETGIGQVNNQVSAIPGLVQGVIDQHLAGLIYFNENQGTTDPYHENWALTTAGMTALRDSLASAR